MREKGINNRESIDREEWRKKIKLKAQQDVILYINNTHITTSLIECSANPTTNQEVAGSIFDTSRI